MKTVAPEILNGLAEYDSATVQNAAAIVYGGYISEHIDYSGPDLKPYLWNQDGSGKAVVGYAMTSTWKPIHGINGRSQEPSGRWDYYDAIANLNAPSIVVQQDIDTPSRRAAILGDEMAHQMSALGSRRRSSRRQRPRHPRHQPRRPIALVHWASSRSRLLRDD